MIWQKSSDGQSVVERNLYDSKECIRGRSSGGGTGCCWGRLDPMNMNYSEEIDLILAVPDDVGWAPIAAMADLLGHYVGAAPITVNATKSIGKTVSVRGLLPRLRGGGRQAIVIASDPGQLNAILQPRFLVRRYRRIVGWVIDSFWVDRIPFVARSAHAYDAIFVTDPSDVTAWREAGVANLGWLPWGTNALKHAESSRDVVKDIDLLRVGRQPQAWADDQRTMTMAKASGLAFHGRPAFGSSSAESARLLNQSLSRAKFVLAFSNKVSPARYTHPSKDYVTGRWLDALANGCMVVGKRPESEATERLLWAGSTVEISPDDLQVGLASIKALVDSWTPQLAEEQQRRALKTLDWRWRFKELLDHMSFKSENLEDDLIILSRKSEGTAP